MASDQRLPLAGECLDRGAETVLDKAMSFERLSRCCAGSAPAAAP